MSKTLNLPYKIYACGRVGVCVHIHTDYRYGRWRGGWNTDLLFSNTNFIFTNTYFIFFEHEFYFFEHEFYLFEHELNELNESWCLRNINLARIKRIVMNGTGSRNWSKGLHTDLTLTDFLMQRRIDGMKRIFRNRTFSWKTDGVFIRWNEYLCKTEGGNE